MSTTCLFKEEKESDINFAACYVVFWNLLHDLNVSIKYIVLWNDDLTHEI